MTGIESPSETPEIVSVHEVSTVVDGIRAIAMCASARGHDTVATGNTTNRVIAEVINLMGWVGANESSLLGPEWLTFMTDLHAHLNGRDWPSCRALMSAALLGAPELGVPSLGVATNGFVEMCSSENGFYFLKVLSSRGARRAARHALEATTLEAT